jgi:APA family basic amino acid/polyamine antiporter
LAFTSSVLLGVVHEGWASLEDLVTVANLFFLGNALLGLAAAWKILPTALWRVVVVVLAAVLVVLAAQGHWIGWLFVAAVTAATWIFRPSRKPKPTS